MFLDLRRPEDLIPDPFAPFAPQIGDIVWPDNVLKNDEDVSKICW